ncbi:MAG: hypothetical protein IJ775_00245, partial [Muribaculaceae bacterium]|nr:hypothetical protein [Muribaculaceae bacterium]
QPVPEAAPSGQAYYALGTTSDGRVGFVSQVANTSTGINGNRGYYLGPQTAVLPINYEVVTLAELLQKGDTKGRYEITDLNLVESVLNHENEDQLLICKDNNEFAEKDRENYVAGMVDYMAYGDAAGTAYTDYDESNWVLLRVPAKFPVTSDMMRKSLNNVKGRLTNRVNPEFLVESSLEGKGNVTAYDPNLFIPSSFAGTQKSQVTGETYFFVTPKPMELARVKWAIWDGNKFNAPNATKTGNEAELSGSFGVNQSYMKQEVELESNMGYSMTAVIKVNEASGSAAPRRAAAAAGYVAWPLTMQQDQQIITGVKELVKLRQVAGVTYYDIAGQPSRSPRSGLNIVVTRYTDGTSTAEKRIY